MREFLIRRADGDWLRLHRDRFADVLKPRSVSSEIIAGWGDHRIRVGDIEMSFSFEDPGLQVTLEGDLAEAEARRLVDEISSSLAEATAEAVEVVALSGARPAARVLLVREDDHLLLLEARDRSSEHRWWVAPGGGLKAGESFVAAASRELLEETGLTLPIGPWVWTRRHTYSHEGRTFDQYERYFVVRSPTESRIVPREVDDYVVGYRWWSLEAIESSREDFAPRRLARLLPPIVRGEYPHPAIDCGV